MGCSAETQRVIRTVGFVVSIIISVGFFTAVYIIQNHMKKQASYLESCSFEECPENCKFVLEYLLTNPNGLIYLSQQYQTI